ncbi:MAG: beta-ketoacyl-ACP synthase, partial [Elusimicrobia bacterium]|nr:beta-ketoacyl-ACP synthase [Elusimicrobiota bacterium]
MERKVVVTGIGLVTPLGLDRETTWKALCEGRNAVRQVEGLPVAVAAPVAWTPQNGLPRVAA